MKVTDTDAVALWQKPPKEPHDSLQVTAVSPLYARYTTSVDAAPAASIMYVSICKQRQNQGRWIGSIELIAFDRNYRYIYGKKIVFT